MAKLAKKASKRPADAKAAKRPGAAKAAKRPGAAKAAKRPVAAKPAGKKPNGDTRSAKLPRLRETVGRAAGELTPDVLDRLFAVVLERREASPEVSHSARLLSRGVAKVAQKFGEEAVECLIEAVAGNAEALVAESADVLYHMLVLWVAAGVRPAEVWAELERREGVSGVAEKASRARSLPLKFGLRTTKIP